MDKDESHDSPPENRTRESITLNVSIEDKVQQTLAEMDRLGLDIARTHDSGGMVLVREDSAEAAKHQQPGNRVSAYQVGENIYWLCHG